MNQQRVLYFDVRSRHAAIRPATTRVNTRVLGLTVTFLLLIGLGALLYLSQASTAAQLRYHLAETEQVQSGLQEEITALRCEIAAAESITSLEGRVAALGLVDAPPDEAVMICQIPAELPRPVGAEDAVPRHAPAGDSLLGRLLSLLALRPRSPARASLY
ncbi:MAG: hypothetical protein K6V36_14585 [Anaerolineae bacterium]|nr:hypothetical protein [Anaerolineae bacterium]